jgi:hypothetical protein
MSRFWTLSEECRNVTTHIDVGHAVNLCLNLNSKFKRTFGKPVARISLLFLATFTILFEPAQTLHA